MTRTPGKGSLGQAGADAGKVQFATIGVNLLEALRQGQIDVGLVQEPALTLLQQAGALKIDPNMTLKQLVAAFDKVQIKPINPQGEKIRFQADRARNTVADLEAENADLTARLAAVEAFRLAGPSGGVDAGVIATVGDYLGVRRPLCVAVFVP